MKLDKLEEPSYNVETVAVTGTREGMTPKQRQAFKSLLVKLKVSVLIHGDCVGADAQMDRIAKRLDLRVKTRPANMPKYRAHCEDTEILADPEDPLVRNRKMVDETKVLIACPQKFKNELLSGTWSTVRYAKNTDSLVWIVYPDGSVVGP